jgi:hypothetical protein
MNKKYEIFWNNIELLFLSPNKDEWNINEDFNYQTKLFTVSRWVQDLFKLDSEQEIKIQLILYDIIKKLNDKSKVKRLDYLQKLKINKELCWIIDNWEDICLLLPSEY